MSYREGNHPIAYIKSCVDFYEAQTETQRTEMQRTIREQFNIAHGTARAPTKAPAEVKVELERRKNAGARIRKRPAKDLGLWHHCHAVSLRDPFSTCCGLTYTMGCQVNGYRQPVNGTQTVVRTFEAVDIRWKCMGCAGIIGADPDA